MPNVLVNVILPGRSDGDLLADGLRDLTKAIHDAGLTNADASFYGLGGEFGYGVDYENDTFLMHRYCWCEKDDCLWCGGSSCANGYPELPAHAGDCYQTRIAVLRKRYGKKIQSDNGEDWGYSTYGNKSYERAVKALCKELDADPRFGSETHCTCGADKERKRIYDACQCDWHLGKGIFRFGPAQDAPHFWHKPSGFKLRWYKWIGRSMETEGAVDIATMLRECMDSLHP